MNIDVEIYVKSIIDFFEKNPNDLSDLIGVLKKERFYDLIKDAAYKNFDDGIDYVITQQQLLDIVVSMFDEVNTPKTIVELKVPVLKTSYGFIWLN